MRVENVSVAGRIFCSRSCVVVAAVVSAVIVAGREFSRSCSVVVAAVAPLLLLLDSTAH